MEHPLKNEGFYAKRVMFYKSGVLTMSLNKRFICFQNLVPKTWDLALVLMFNLLLEVSSLEHEFQLYNYAFFL